MTTRPVTPTEDGPYQVSASKVTMALSCPLKAQRKYIHRLPVKPSLPAHRGQMLHKGLEATRGDGQGLADQVTAAWRDNAPPPWGELFKPWLDLQADMAPVQAELDALADQIKADAEAGKRKAGGQAPRMTNDYKRREAELLAPWTDTLDSLRAAERELLDDPDRSPWEATDRSGFAEYASSLDVARAYTTWWDQTPRDDRPEVLAVERGFKHLLEEFELVGFIDVIMLDPTRDAVMVRDWKTGRGFDKAERFVQAAFYAIGAEQAVGARPDYVQFVNLDQDMALDTYPVRPLWDIKLVDLCRYARTAIEGPPVPSFKGCSWCSYAPLCFDATDGAYQFTPIESLQETAS